MAAINQRVRTIALDSATKASLPHSAGFLLLLITHRCKAESGSQLSTSLDLSAQPYSKSSFSHLQ